MGKNAISLAITIDSLLEPLRSSITIRKTGDEVEEEPGLFEVDTVAVHALAAMTGAVEAVPFAVTGLDFGNGGEFINHDSVDWAAGRHIFFALRTWP